MLPLPARLVPGSSTSRRSERGPRSDRKSLCGEERWGDNVFVERLWRSVKYEGIYLHAHETMRKLKTVLAKYFDFHNAHRVRQNLEDRTPDEVTGQDVSR